MSSQEEFEQTALPHTRGLLRFARRLTGNSNAAEDLVQEALLQAWRNFHQFEAGSNIRAWLFRIVVNVQYGEARTAKRRVAVVPIDSVDRFHASSQSTHATLEVIEALDQLQPEHKSALVLATIEGFSCREIAEILSLPIGTVMSRLSRARQALREKLAVETILENR